MARKKTTTETFGYTARIPMELHDDLDLLARYNYRSLNAEIVLAIKEHLELNKALLDEEKRNQESL